MSQLVPGNHDFIPFDKFIEQVKGAKFEYYHHGAVESAEAFAEMRTHTLTMYDSVSRVPHSFCLSDEYIDCIDRNKQPSVRIPGHTIIEHPPPFSADPKIGSGEGGGELCYIESPLKRGLKDRYGNDVSCPEGTIPIARISLEKLTRFSTLQHFFAKRSERLAQEPHQYAYSYQNVANHGGNSWLNIWKPVGDFSLSQQWYDADSGDILQTVEGGWIVYQDKFSTTEPVLFIYYTPDNYKTGCYNLDQPGFVQTSSVWVLGGALWPCHGNWWLFIKGAGGIETVGYYPASVYKGGPLPSGSKSLTYGGEVTRTSSADKWPQMGSSRLPGGGFGYSAYQNHIFYIAVDGSTVWTDLTGRVIGPTSYWDITVTESGSGGSWGTYFYFGGPGGP